MNVLAFLIAVYATWGAFSSRLGPSLSAIAFAIALLAITIGDRP